MTKTNHSIKICCGTMCYIMGGAEMHLIREHLPEPLQDQVQIEGISCLGLCEKEGDSQHPYVLINNEVMPKASIQKIIQYIQNLK